MRKRIVTINLWRQNYHLPSKNIADMKKHLFIILMLLSLVSISMQAECNNICGRRITMTHVPVNTNGGSTKSPSPRIIVFQEGHSLTFPEFWDFVTLQLIDSNNNIVFTSPIPNGSTTLTLPLSLSGNYEIRFVASTYYYIGNITFE